MLENGSVERVFLGAKAGDHQDDQACQNVQRRPEKPRLGLWAWARSSGHKDSLAACVEDGVDLEAGQASSWTPREAPLSLSEGYGAVTSSATECAGTSSDSVLLQTSADAELASSKEQLLIHRGIAVQQNRGATAVKSDLLSIIASSIDDPKAIRKLNWKHVLTSNLVKKHFSNKQ